MKSVSRIALWPACVSVAAPFLLLLASCRGEPAQLGGTWAVNLKHSDWGRAAKPVSIVVAVDHNEPALTYSGTVTYADGDWRAFGFAGSINGQEYPVTRSCGSGSIVLRRLDARTVSSVFHSADGRCTETARTTISRNGKQMVRRMHATGPQGDLSWTEVYERQQAGRNPSES